MGILKVDMQPSSYLWTNSSKPVAIITDQGNSTRNAIQASNTGTNSFQIQLNTLYGEVPLVSELSQISFYTQRESNATNKDWYITLGLDNNSEVSPDTPEITIYPRNSSNYEYYSGIWMLVDQSVLQFDLNGSLSSFANFKMGQYSTYSIKSITIATEQLAGFEGMISDIDITFTGKDDLLFLMENSTNSTIIGGADATVFVQNKNIVFSTANSTLLLDGNNGQVTIQGGKLSILSTLSNNLDMGGFGLSNMKMPIEITQAANKQYVDGFFDQLVAQMQWFNSTLAADESLSFTTGNLTQDLPIMATVHPDALNDTIDKLSSSSFELAPSNFRVEVVLKIKYLTGQSNPLDLQLTEVDSNGDPVANSQLTYIQTSFKPFGLDQYVTSSLFTTFAISVTSRFKIQLISPVAQSVVVRADSSIYINRLFDQSANGTYQPISTSYTPLNLITAPTGDVSLSGFKLSNIADPTLDTDALNRQSADDRYYLNSVTLNNVTAPTDSLSLNSQKITNLATPALDTDASTKAYVDTQIAGIVNSAPSTLDTLNELASALNNDVAFSTTVTNQIATKLATADFNTTFDTRYAATSITSGLAPTANLSMNSRKITNLANATLSTDALNRSTGDSRYYLATTVLNSITAPTSSLSLNSQKITNLATPTSSTDATTKGYVDSLMSGISSAPVGSIFMYINVSPPTDYLICNGASLSRTTYSTLFALIGTQYGTASLTTFNLPDFRGVVPRGFNDTAADAFFDPDSTSRVARYIGGATGNTLGSYQQDEVQSHDHDLGRQYASGTSASQSLERGSGFNGSMRTDPTGGNETRAKNVYVIFIIKVQ